MSFRHVILAVLVVAIWGFNFVVIEIGLREFPPLFLTALRFILVAFPAIFILRKPDAPMSLIALYGTFMFALQFAFLFVGMYLGISAGLASLVLQFQVIVTVVLSAVFLGERTSFQKIIGISVAFSGLALVGWQSFHSATITGFVLVLCAAGCWGVANLTSKKIATSNVLSLVVWGGLWAPVPLLLASYYFEGAEAMLTAIGSVSWIGIGALAYIVYPTTFFGFSVWSKLLNAYPASLVAPFTLLVPVFGMFFAAAVLDEPMPIWKIITATLVLLGIAFNTFNLKPAKLQ